MKEKGMIQLQRTGRFAVAVMLMAGLGLAPAAAAEPAEQKHQPNPKLAALPVNAWVRVADKQPAPDGILAYAGGIFDSEHNVYLLFGGGHADYWGNEVCALDIKALTWKRMYEPDAQARYTNDNIDHAKGKLKDSDKPYTRHSYQMQVFVPTAKKMFIWSGCGPGWGKIAPTCVSPKDAWYYDCGANKWELVATDGPACYGGGTCYDSKRDAIWALPGVSWPKLWKFDVKTAKWSSHALKPESSATCHLDLVYNPKRDLIAAAVGERQKAYVINPETFTVEQPDTSLYKPHGGGGMVYLPEQDVAVNVFKEGGVLDFETRKWYPLAPGKVFEGSSWIYGNCNYSPIDKVIIVVNAKGTWAYKPPEKYDLAALAKSQSAPDPGK